MLHHIMCVDQFSCRMYRPFPQAVLLVVLQPAAIRHCTAACTACQVDIYSNYEQYGLQQPVGLVRMDVHTPPFRQGLAEVRPEAGVNSY
jgi:hypothetical protein